MPSAGPLNPSSATASGSAGSTWTNVGNVLSSNNVYASTSGTGLSNLLVVSGFGFEVPPAVIDGVLVESELTYNGSGSGASLESVALRYGGAQIGTADTTATSLTSGDVYYSRGGSLITFDASLTWEIVNDPIFGVAIVTNNPVSSRIAYCDHIRVTVYYTENSTPNITSGPDVSYGAGTQLEQANTPAVVTFTATDAEQTGTDALNWTISTESAGAGTIVASGTATSGLPENVNIEYNAPGLTRDGAQTLYLAVDDGISAISAAFTLVQAELEYVSSGTALITLTHTSTITVSLPCRRRWVLASSGQVGEASFTIPHDSPAASLAYINPDGGSFVHIGSTARSGRWNGIITALSSDENGTTVTASQPTVILSRIPAGLNQTFRNVFPRDIVQLAFNAAANASGTYPLAVGAIASGLPLIETYSVHGESVWSVLLDMMATSGQELSIIVSDDHDQPDELVWGGNTGTVHDGILLAPGQFRDATYGLDISEQASRVTGLSDYRFYTVSAPDVAANSNWPAHIVVKTSRPSDIQRLAEDEANRRLVPAVTISGAVPSGYWDIREGDYIRVLLTRARFSGTTALVRVISREIPESGDVMLLELATVSDVRTGNRALADLRQVRRDEQRGRRYLTGGA